MAFPDDEFSRNREFEKQTICLAKAVLGQVLMCEAPMQEDRRQNADLVLVADGYRYPCRMRRNDPDKPIERNWDRKGSKSPDVTFRFSLANGSNTEFQKLLDGYGDYMFYGICNPDLRTLWRWVILDLGAVRNALGGGDLVLPPRSVRRNRDGVTSFLPVDTFSLSPACIRAAYRWRMTEVQANAALSGQIKWFRAGAGFPVDCGDVRDSMFSHKRQLGFAWR